MPMPGVGTPAPVGPGAPPAGPPGPGNAPPAQPPQPTAYQTPQNSDLGQMYMQLVQQQSAKEGFWRGLAGMDAALYPGRQRGQAQMIAGIGQPTESAGNMFNNLMRLQGFNIQNQVMQQQMAQRQDMLNNPEQYAKAFGLEPDQFKAVVASQSPDTLGATLGKIAEVNAGVGGSPAWQAQVKAEKALMKAGTPMSQWGWTPGDPASYAAAQAQNLTERKDTAQALVANKQFVEHAGPAYDNMIADAQKLLADPSLDNILGPINQYNKSGNPLNSADTTRVLALYDKIMAKQYAGSVQDFKGARVTQQEVSRDAPGQSMMGARNLSPLDFRAGIQDYINNITQKRNLLYSAAGEEPPPLNPASGGGGGYTLQGSKDLEGDYAKIPPDTDYIDPEGNPRHKPKAH